MKRTASRLTAFLCAALLLPMIPTAPAGAVTSGVFAHGVAAGEIRDTSALLWTRAETADQVVAEVATDPAFTAVVFTSSPLTADSGSDFTLKVPVSGLTPATAYWYRFSETSPGSGVSGTGRFRTAPAPGSAASLSLVLSGDANTLTDPETGDPVYGDFHVLSTAAAENPDLFVFLGDTIYSDNDGPITALDDYRAKYKKSRDATKFPGLQEILRSTGELVQWDDHEVVNDWNPVTVDPQQKANGLQAFKEYNPVSGDPYAPSAPRFFKKIEWGSDVDIFVLDERAYRSPQADQDPAHPGACTNPSTGESDLAPTTPNWVRGLFGLLLKPLRSFPSADCYSILADPSRSMLGAEQKAWFLDALQASTARVKLIVNEVPIQEYYALPYDRWEGYPVERAEIVNTIRNKKIPGVFWLTTDSHANYTNRVKLDSLTNLWTILFPVTGGVEFVTGPIGTETYSEEVSNVVGSIGPTAIRIVFNLVGARCVDLDRNSYGLLQYDPVAHTLTFQPKDADGNPICGAGFTYPV